MEFLTEILGGGAVSVLIMQGVVQIVKVVKTPTPSKNTGEPSIRDIVFELVSLSKHNEINMGALMQSMTRVNEVLIKVGSNQDEIIRLARLMQERVLRGDSL